MIYYILTGHGEFSPGISKSLEMIVGPQKNFSVVPFYETDPLEKYENDLTNSLVSAIEQSDGVIIFTDLLGGTPFRVSMEISSKYQSVEVIVGTNLPMLIEGSLMRETDDNVHSLADKLVEIGKIGVSCIRMDRVKQTLKDDSEEGGI